MAASTNWGVLFVGVLVIRLPLTTIGKFRAAPGMALWKEVLGWLLPQIGGSFL